MWRVEGRTRFTTTEITDRPASMTPVLAAVERAAEGQQRSRTIRCGDRLGEVGIRKPDPAIYRLAAKKLGLPIGACALVDDVAANLTSAAEIGMATIHHTDSAATVRGA